MRWVPILLILLLSLTQSSGQVRTVYSWYDFETTSTLPKFKPFGTTYEVFENPDRNEVNPSLLVGRVVKIPGRSIGWSGVLIIPPDMMNLSKGAHLKMKVYATTKGGTVQVKLETEPKSIHAYSTLKIEKLNEWHDLVFHFNKRPQENYTKLVLIFDYGGVEDHIFYFDDLVWIEGDMDNQMR